MVKVFVCLCLSVHMCTHTYEEVRGQLQASCPITFHFIFTIFEFIFVAGSHSVALAGLKLTM